MNFAIRILILASALIAATQVHVRSEIYYVNPAGSGDYPTIQDAIDTAVAGDTILADQGVYVGAGNVRLNFGGVDLVLLSISGPESTVIDGEEVYRANAFRFASGESPSAVVDGFCIRRFVTDWEGAVTCEFGSSPSLKNLIIENNIAGGLGGSGGGLACFDSSPLLSDVLFRENSSDENAGGMLVQGESSPTLTRVTFESNYTNGLGGGLLWASPSAPILADVRFADNAGCQGGGLAILREDVSELIGIVFEENEACQGGGLLASGPISIIDCTFFGNRANWANGEGGGLYVGNTCLGRSASSLQILGCTFAFNQAENGGSGFFVKQTTVTTIQNTVCAFNSGSVGIEWDGFGQLPEIECCNVFGNPDGDYGDSIPNPTGLNGNLSSNPFFCGGVFPSDFSLELHANSPCLPGNNSCGLLIGAHGMGCIATSMVEFSTSQDRISIEQNHPNPANPATTIQFALASPTSVSLVIYDLFGRIVSVLLDNSSLLDGRHSVRWDGRDSSGAPQPSGVYLYRLNAGDAVESRKLILLK